MLETLPVDGDGEPGTLLDGAPTLACGEGALRLVRLLLLVRRGFGKRDLPVCLDRLLVDLLVLLWTAAENTAWP